MEVKSAVTEMKGGFPPSSDLREEKNEKDRRIWGERARELERVLESVKSLSLYFMSICLTFEILIIDWVWGKKRDVLSLLRDMFHHTRIFTRAHTLAQAPVPHHPPLSFCNV